MMVQVGVRRSQDRAWSGITRAVSNRSGDRAGFDREAWVARTPGCQRLVEYVQPEPHIEGAF
jgi:hypothetical protein